MKVSDFPHILASKLFGKALKKVGYFSFEKSCYLIEVQIWHFWLNKFASIGYIIMEV